MVLQNHPVVEYADLYRLLLIRQRFEYLTAVDAAIEHPGAKHPVGDLLEEEIFAERRVHHIHFGLHEH